MKTLFIVGGSSGIGYATVKRFSKEGYKIINLSRTECNYNGVTNLLCDVTVREKLDEALQTVIQENSLDCFIYSAGFSMAAPLEYVKEGDYRYLYEVNLFAFLHCLQTLIPLLRNARGTACIISSIGAIQQIPFDCYYSGSKAALNATISALKYELFTEGINVISVMPGGTKTYFSFKRKVYSPAEIDGYSKQMSLAVDALQNVEQKGMSPAKVANTIYNKCTKQPCFTSVYASGLLNKMIVLATKLMPQGILHLIGKTMFETDTEEN